MADRKYSSYLRSLVTGEKIFPLRIRFGVPSTTDEFAKLQKEITALAAGNFGYTIEWEEKDTRKWGRQRLPTQVRFDTEEQFVSALEKEEEITIFKRNLELTLLRIPNLRGWLVSHARSLIDHGFIWKDMISVCEYFLANPRPGLYTRQLPIPVHTKFISENRQVLNSMLDSILPDTSKSNGDTFESRFGLRECESLIRCRVLDPELLAKLRISHEDIGLSVSALAALPVSALRVIVTENLMNFLCLPPLKNSLALFGHGNAAELLTQIPWLQDCEALYWGDIDEHGFQILSRLRRRFPALKSILMGIHTLRMFENLLGKGEPAGMPPTNLTAEELAAYELVREQGLRLEQEKIPQHHFQQALREICFKEDHLVSVL